MSTGTLRLHRVLRAPPERVYRAFLDAEALAKWLPPNGFTRRVHDLDAKVGGGFRMSFTNFTTRRSHAFGGVYLELLPGERVCYTDEFDDPNLVGTMKTMASMTTVSCGISSTSCRKASPRPYRSKRATSVGRTRWCSLQSASSPRSGTSDVKPAPLRSAC